MPAAIAACSVAQVIEMVPGGFQGGAVRSRGPGVTALHSYCNSLLLIVYSVSLKIYKPNELFPLSLIIVLKFFPFFLCLSLCLS